MIGATRALGGWSALASIAAAASGCLYTYPDTGGAGAASSTSASIASSASGASTTGAGGEGGAPPDMPFYAEGSRLKARYIDFGGGATQFIGWFDTQLGVDCSFAVLPTGDIACVPNTGDASTYYEDSGCTSPLMLTSQGPCAVPSYAGTQGAPSCDTPNSLGAPSTAGPATVRTAGAKFTGTTVYTKVNGVCTPGMAPSVFTFYSTGSAVPISSFVNGHLEKEPRGDHLFAEFYVGDDGSRQLRRSLSASSNSSGFSQCLLQKVDGDELCLPIFNGYVNETPAFTDTNCTMPLTPAQAYVRHGICEPPEYLRDTHVDGQGCTSSVDFFSVGGPATPPPVYTGMPGSCQPLQFSNYDPVMTGAPLDVATQFGGIVTESFGSGRIQAEFFGTGPTDALSSPNTFVDSSDGSTCAPVLFDDGVIRCVPADVQRAYYYANATCTMPIVVVYPNACAPAAPPPTRALSPSNAPPKCSLVAAAGAMFSLAPYSGSIYTNSSGTCTSTTFGMGAVAYALKAPLDVSGFSVVELVDGH